MTELGGSFDAGFTEVVELFKQQGLQQPRGGSSLSIFKDGHEVVNVWQGEAKQNQPWRADTISTVFSCTKGVVSVLLAKLIEEKKLDPNEKVAIYWPEFAQGGKQDITVRMVLQHRAGLSAVRRDLTYEEAVDDHTIISELAKQAPLWEPDTSNAYHALTFGHLASKLIHCVTGQTANEYLQAQATSKLGIDIHIGLPKEKFSQLAPLISDGTFKAVTVEPNSNAYWCQKAMSFGGAFPAEPTAEHGFNDEKTLMAELAGANGVTNAHGLAKVYSAAVTETDGVRLVSDEGIRTCLVASPGPDNFFDEPRPFPIWGMGFMLPMPGVNEMPGKEGFGHNGFGGQAGWGSLDARIGFGYTNNYMQTATEMQKNQQDLVKALNAVLVGK